jgi:hypothetical protein
MQAEIIWPGSLAEPIVGKAFELRKLRYRRRWPVAVCGPEESSTSISADAESRHHK